MLSSDLTTVIVWDNEGKRTEHRYDRSDPVLDEARKYRNLSNSLVQVADASGPIYGWRRVMWISDNRWTPRTPQKAQEQFVNVADMASYWEA